MKQYPILFSDEMVTAILKGRKTQTRRPMACRRNCAPMPTHLWNRLVWDDALVPAGARKTFVDDGYLHGYLHVATRPHPDDPPDEWTLTRVYPKYQAGDQLWVRETWAEVEWSEGGAIERRVLYRADDPGDSLWRPEEGDKWRPSIFMPREASRIMLEVTAVRCERVQKISEADAMAEGCKQIELGPFSVAGLAVHPRTGTYRDAYQVLWDSLYGKQHSWQSNPWVAVYTLTNTR